MSSPSFKWCLSAKLKGGEPASKGASDKTAIREGDIYQIVRQPQVLRAPTESEATIRVAAAALNHRDNWIAKGMYPQIRSGVTLGADCCGYDEKTGQRVVVDPSVGWGPNDAAPVGPALEILGMPRDGAFASRLIVPKENLRPAPAHLNDAQCASLPLAGVTAYRALVTRGKAKKGDYVLVTGIGGGVATLAVQFAVALGCRVFVTSSSQAKIDRAVKELGAAGGVLYTQPKWNKALLGLTQGRKLDVAIDGAGGEGLGDIVRLMAGGGRVVTYGGTAGGFADSVNLASLFLNNVDLVGTAMGSPRDFDGMLRLVEASKIVPVVDALFDLETEFPRALERMRDGAQFGKLVVVADLAQKKAKL